MITKQEIKRIRSLGDKTARRESGLFIAEGEKLVDEIVASRFVVGKIFATEPRAGAELISRNEMERISMLKTPTTVMALVEIPRYELRTVPVGDNELVLVLDGVQDPGNLGTIIRLADWFSIRDIYCSPQSADLYNPKVVQATMGAITRVRVHYTDLVTMLARETPTGVSIYGTFLDGDNIYTQDLSAYPSGFIVMGSEGRGISPEIERLITRKLYIPPFPATSAPTGESLNVAIATAIICSEFRRGGCSR